MPLLPKVTKEEHYPTLYGGTRVTSIQSGLLNLIIMFRKNLIREYDLLVGGEDHRTGQADDEKIKKKNIVMHY
jgi:hypothetical protein